MKGSPFTQLCCRLALVKNPGRADLHTHTHFSDGTHTPDSLVDRAFQAGLRAVAITDHDATGAIEPARIAAAGRIEVIAGVEVTCEFRGHELHLLGYFIRTDDVPLSNALAALRQSRRERFLEIARRIRLLDSSIEEMVALMPEQCALGRRHLARFMIERGLATSMHDAFSRVLTASTLADVPKMRLPVGEAIKQIVSAGGVTSWAHPPEGTNEAVLRELHSMGLQAVECEYPWRTRTHSRRMQGLAERVGLAITGGSDSHDPGPRSIGMRTIGLDSLDRIRQLANP